MYIISAKELKSGGFTQENSGSPVNLEILAHAHLLV